MLQRLFWRPVRLLLEVGGWNEVLGPLHGLGALQKPGMLMVSWAADDVQTLVVKGSPTRRPQQVCGQALTEEQFTGLRAEGQGSDFAEKEDSLRVLRCLRLDQRAHWPVGPRNLSEAKAFALIHIRGARPCLPPGQSPAGCPPQDTVLGV